MAIAGSGPNFRSLPRGALRVAAARPRPLWAAAALSECLRIFLREREAFSSVEIAHDQQHRIIRRVVGAGRISARLRASRHPDRRSRHKIVRVGPVAKSHRRQIQPRETAIGWFITFTRTSSFTTSRWLRRFSSSTFRARMRSASSHSTRSRAFRRDGFEIIGDVVVCRAIEQAAGRIDEANVFHLARVFRALEHHVLEKVRETAAAKRFEAEADLIIEPTVTKGAVRSGETTTRSPFASVVVAQPECGDASMLHLRNACECLREAKLSVIGGGGATAPDWNVERPPS